MSELSVKERDLLQRIDKKEDLRPLFFRKVKGIKWFDELSKRGYFKPDQNPRPITDDEEGYVTIPIWQVLHYLVKTAPELASENDNSYAEKFLKILMSTTEYARANKFGNHRTWGEFSEIIGHIPSELLKWEDLEIIDYWLDDRYENGYVAERLCEKWLLRLLASTNSHERKLGTQLLKYIYKIVFVDRDEGERKRPAATLRVDHHYIDRITKRVAKRSGQGLGRPAVLIFDRQLRRILETLNNDSWSCLWQPAIEEHEQNKYRHDAENVLIEAYRDSLAGYVLSKPTKAVDYIAEMFSDQNKTIRRLAIHTVDTNYEICQGLSDMLIDRQHFEDNVRHETWQFLSHHYCRLGEHQKREILNLILQISKSDDDGKVHIKATAYSQAIWLAAIKRFGSTEKDLYDEKCRVAESEPDNPSFSSYMTGGEVLHESPIPLHILQGMEVDELTKELEEYNEEEWSFFEPGIEGLSTALREIIKASPLKYYPHLASFVTIDLRLCS